MIKLAEEILLAWEDGIYARLNAEGGIVAANVGFLRLTGEGPSPVGRAIVEYLPDWPPKLDGGRASLKALMRFGSNAYSCNIQVSPCKDGMVLLGSAPLLTYGDALAKMSAFESRLTTLNRELMRRMNELERAKQEIRTLQGILPICSYCKKIRDEEGAWHQVEVYVARRTDAEFSHGICKECAKLHFPEFDED